METLENSWRFLGVFLLLTVVKMIGEVLSTLVRVKPVIFILLVDKIQAVKFTLFDDTSYNII